MNDQDLAKIKFRFVSHVMPTSIWESVDYEPRITVYTHAHVKDNSKYSRSITHYMFNGNTYKTKKKLLEAMTAFEDERKSKFEKK